MDRLRHRVEKILAEEHGIDPAAVMPARATFYRLAARADSGKHTFGSARSRRSQAKTPGGPYGTVTASRPGEWTQIDSTPLDVRVVLDNGMTDRAELTWLIDIATRTIPAAVLRTSTTSVDAALLLARSMTPEPMRPGWPDALRMSRSVMPHRRLAGIDRRLADAAARPVIVPETIVCDHGSVYMSQAFRGACRAMGITLQPSHEGSPRAKPRVAYCTSSGRFAARWRSCRSDGVVPASLVAGWRVGSGGVVEDFAFVVIPLPTDNPGVVPDLDGAGGHAEQLGHLAERDQAVVQQALAAAA